MPTTTGMLGLILGAWGSMLVGIVAHLLSHWFAITGIRVRQDNVGKILRGEVTPTIREYPIDGEEALHKIELAPKTHLRGIQACNLLASLGLLIGVGLLATYVALIQYERLEEKQKTEASEVEHARNWVPPKQ